MYINHIVKRGLIGQPYEQVNAHNYASKHCKCEQDSAVIVPHKRRPCFWCIFTHLYQIVFHN